MWVIKCQDHLIIKRSHFPTTMFTEGKYNLKNIHIENWYFICCRPYIHLLITELYIFLPLTRGPGV